MLRVGARIGRAELVARLKADDLLASLGWLGLSEIVLRLARIITTIVVARALLPVDFGLAATAIAVFELVRVFARAGLMPALVRADTSELPAVAETVFKLACRAAIAAAVLQLVVGLGLAHFMARPELTLMLGVLAVSFVLQPFGMVQEALMQRDGRMKAYGAIAAAQIIAESFGAACFALAGFGAWSLILPKLLAMPVWLFAVRRQAPWERIGGKALPSQHVLSFSMPVIASDLMAALRLNLDKAIVGAILGLEALGVYFFAFNAGFGLSLTLTSALSTAAFAHLARAQHADLDMGAAFRSALVKAIAPVCLIIIAQALAAVVYVPMLFGQKWAFASPIVAILCLAAATKPLFDGAAQLLRVVGRPLDEMRGAALVSCLVLSSLAAALTHGLYAGVVAFTVAATISHISFSIWAYRLVSRDRVTRDRGLQ